MKRNPWGHQHQTERAAWEPLIATGQIHCTGPQGCGQPIHPNEPWDLGHTIDAHNGGNGPRVPQHAHCNRSAGARLRNGTPTTNSTRAL